VELLASNPCQPRATKRFDAPKAQFNNHLGLSKNALILDHADNATILGSNLTYYIQFWPEFYTKTTFFFFF
jgi:hypothetical protein